MVATKKIAEYVNKKGINLSAMSRSTGISYSALYASLKDKSRERPLSMDEGILVCRFLEVNPMDFAEQKEEVG